MKLCSRFVWNTKYVTTDNIVNFWDVCGCVVIKNVICALTEWKGYKDFSGVAYLLDEYLLKQKWGYLYQNQVLIINKDFWYLIFDINPQNKIKSIPHKFQVPSGVPYICFSL